jgi:hypothetical protein
MKKLLLIFSIFLLCFNIPATGGSLFEQETIFQRSYNDGNIPDWFGNNDFRGLAYHDGIIYICDKESNGIAKIDAQSGDFVGLVGANTNSTRIPLWDVETDGDGKIFASKMGWYHPGDKMEIYTWDSNGNDAQRDTLITWAPEQDKYRLGDDFTVDGSFRDSTLKIYIANALNDTTCDQLYIWDMAKGIENAPNDTTIVKKLENNFLGLQVDIWPLGGVNTDSVLISGGTQRVRKVDLTTGESTALNKPDNYDYGNGLCAFQLDNEKYFALAASFNPLEDNEQNLQIINYTEGLANVDTIVHKTESLGPMTRNMDFLPKNCDVDMANIEEGSVDIFLLQTDNGFAHYRFKKGNTSIEKNSNNSIESYTLYQNYPNPFNPNTNIRFNVSQISNITLQVIDLQGRVVETKKYQQARPGMHTYHFKARDISSGIYFYRLKAGNRTVATKRMLLLK